MSLATCADASNALVGLIANPASGKDIRRLVAHATTVDNMGKVGIVRRALIGLGASGIRRVAYMPDRYHLVEQALRGLEHSDQATPELVSLPVAVTDRSEDSARAAELLREQGAGCILVLGGDGTVRAVSRGAGEVPLLPISTGTNNVLPSFVEGTIAGMAAGALARGLVPLERVALRHKWIEVWVNGAARDRALVDVAVLRGRWAGSRAVWQAADILAIAVTRADPATIGISAIVGALQPVGPEEPFGLLVMLRAKAQRRVTAAIGPGLVRDIGVDEVRQVDIGQAWELPCDEPWMLALDGEREISLRPGDTLRLVWRGDGPWIVAAERVMRELAVRGMFEHLTQGEDAS